jgi:hypothetical protein
MVNQVVYEFYALHHTQQLMREAQTSRTLNQMRTRKSKKDFRGLPLFARLRGLALKKDLGREIQSTKKVGIDKELISS